ncbi:MAG: phosphoribosylformylglycinamidine cyclo-ligase [Kiritimatiellaeota bacterium]|nr:phosphoribosylformylglycinamidine cyclo-ligase [Kiritimatiellota bacterium]
MKSDSYKDAGVDIDKAQELLSRVKAKISETRRPEMLSPIGGFGGLFQIDLSKHKNPVLVSSVDGVGTKLMIAMMMDKFDTVGKDIVNHCVNDISVQGAEPIYFMDYIGIGKLRSPLYEDVLAGIADACSAAGCAVLGGETAEMPGMYGDDFDLVGSITGIVEKDDLITGERIRPEHIAVAVASNGLHTNGYSLARRVLFEKRGYTVDTPLGDTGETIGNALLKPHICYWSAVKALLASQVSLDGVAHITGGGLYDNVPRVLPDGVDVEFDSTALPVPPICSLIVREGGIGFDESYRVFNMGFGMVFFVPAADADETLAICENNGFQAAICGKTTKGSRNVRISDSV